MQSTIVSGSKDYTARLWDARVGGDSLSSLEGHMNEVTSVQWHSNGNLILSAARDSQIKVICLLATNESSLALSLSLKLAFLTIDSRRNPFPKTYLSHNRFPWESWDGAYRRHANY